MFKDNKYTIWYYKIISSGPDDKGELHHIVPRCIGGTDEEDNIVRLSYRKHYLCHYLLTKMNDSSSLKNAFWQMSVKNKRKHYNSRMYEAARKAYVDSITGDSHWAKTSEFRQKVSNDWNDDRRARFKEKVSGDKHWTRNTDMTDHAAHMRSALSKEQRRAIGKRSVFVTNNPMKNPDIAKLHKKPKERVTCPHCGKTGGKPAMTRYHFDRCKYVRSIQ